MNAPTDPTDPTPTSTDDEAAALAQQIMDLARARDASLLPLMDQGVPIDMQDAAGNTPLMLAAYHGHAELVQALAARGADVDLANDRGQTPLAGAAFKGDLAVARALLEAGADPAAGTPSARDTAAYFERQEIVDLLG